MTPAEKTLRTLQGLPVEHLSAAELVRDLLRPDEGHHGLASRLLGPPGKAPDKLTWVWGDEPRDRHALTSRGRRVMVQSRRGLLREASVFVLAADLQGQPGVAVLLDEALAAATVLIESGAVTVGPALAIRPELPREAAARELSARTPFSYGTCLAVARLVGFDKAEEVLFQAARTSTDPMEVAQARVCHDMATYELRDDDYLGLPYRSYRLPYRTR